MVVIRERRNGNTLFVLDLHVFLKNNLKQTAYYAYGEYVIYCMLNSMTSCLVGSVASLILVTCSVETELAVCPHALLI